MKPKLEPQGSAAAVPHADHGVFLERLRNTSDIFSLYTDMPRKKKNIIFFHPDLGIGGAERLVIDAAVGLQSLGHKVTIFTSHCDQNHCFDEAQDGTLDVRVRGDWLFPATILGRFKILLTILRHLHLLVAITWNGEIARLQPTIFFVDQLSAGMPFMAWRWPDMRILFYCHFPDLLLVKERRKWWRRLWRVIFDLWEEWGMKFADRVVVNSRYTKGVVEGIWKWLGQGKGVGVVHPCVDTSVSGEKGEEKKEIWKNKKVILSINRFEQKKDVGLAIKAFAGLNETEREGARLLITGGYDGRVEENVVYHRELESLALSLGLKAATTKNIVSALVFHKDVEVLFLLSIPAQLKSMLLEAATLLVYTPSNEHFGIVPLEAMLAGVPVLASNNGGPLETVTDGETGWLRSTNDVAQWTDVIKQALFGLTDDELAQMGERGIRRVKEEFSETKMALRLDEEFEAMVNKPRASSIVFAQFLVVGSIVFAVLIVPLCAIAALVLMKVMLRGQQ